MFSNVSSHRPLITLSNLSPFLLSPPIHFSRPLSVTTFSSLTSANSPQQCLPPVSVAATATTPTNRTHSDLLTLISHIRSLRQTKQTHAIALIQGYLPPSVSLCAALIRSYASFGAGGHHAMLCRVLFETTAPFCQTAFLWNTLIKAQSILGTCDEFSVYNGLIRSGVRPDDHTLNFVLKACADHLAVPKGAEVHGTAIKLWFDLDLFVGNTLLLFYSTCGGDLDCTKRVFDEMPVRDVVSWNTMIGAFSVHGFYREAVDVFMEMKSGSDILPTVASLVSLLPACAELKDEITARLVHGYAFKIGLNNVLTVGNALINVYAKCENMDNSRQVFDEMPENNSVSWNAIITGLARIKCHSDCLDTFISMIDVGNRPDGVTVSSVLPVLVELELFDAGKEIHAFTIRWGTDSDLFVSNSLIDMYAKSGNLAKASNVFEKISMKNEVSWNAMIANFTRNNNELKAIALVQEMQVNGVVPTAMTFTNVLPACARVRSLRHGREIHARSIRSGFISDLFLSNALMDMYAKCGSLSSARDIFNVSHRDLVSYNILIVNYAQTEDCLESLNLFKEMDTQGMQRDTVSIMGAISACANLSDLKKGKEIHGFLVRNVPHTHLFIANSLLDLYTKCGRMQLAQRVFEQIPTKDTASWNTMILGYGMISEFHKAVYLFDAMKKDFVDQDSVSYVIILSTCSHGGLVEEGKRYFDEMRAKGDIESTQMHYACMVDLLGRAGLMDEAVELIKTLPVEPDPNVWGALLGACRVHGNIELAKWAAEHLFVLRPEHCGYYTILSNMLSDAGRWDEARSVREMMKSRGVKKNPGFSWVQGQNKVRPFIVGELFDGLDSSPWLNSPS